MSLLLLLLLSLPPDVTYKVYAPNSIPAGAWPNPAWGAYTALLTHQAGSKGLCF